MAPEQRTRLLGTSGSLSYGEEEWSSEPVKDPLMIPLWQPCSSGGLLPVVADLLWDTSYLGAMGHIWRAAAVFASLQQI